MEAKGLFLTCLFSFKCRDFYRELARCSKCDYVFGFNDEGAKWDTFLRHYNKHNKHVTKNMSSREEIDEVTASLVTLPLSQPAPASSSALTQENRVTMEDAEDTEVNIGVCRILYAVSIKRFAFSRTEPTLVVLPRLVPSISKLSREAEEEMIPFLSVWMVRGTWMNLDLEHLS